MFFTKQMLRIIACVLLLCMSIQGFSQQISWEEYMSSFADMQQDNPEAWQTLYEDLSYLHDHPININRTSAKELRQLPFLTESIIENILVYAALQGPVRSLGELNLISQLDYEKRELLTLFITCGEPDKQEYNSISFKNLAQYGKHQILSRTDIPFNTQDSAYLGQPWYESIRYQYVYSNRVEAGFTFEKDRGEPLFKQVNKWFDNCNYYVVIKDLGVLKTLALGKYNLHFGQGLVLNTRYSLGKMGALSKLQSVSNRGIYKHSSTSEFNYLQGVAMQFDWGNWQLYTFGSYRYQDANLDKNQLITSLKTDGYHRTTSEIQKKNNVSNLLLGTHLQWSYKDFHVGLTTAYTYFNRPFINNDGPTHYKHYYPQGQNFGNIGINYGYLSYKLSFQGEVAMDFQGGLATVHSMLWRTSERLSLQAVYRYYAKNYQALLGNSFGESSAVRNEHGLYLGTNYQLSDRWKISGYVDVWNSPWYQYQVAYKNAGGIDGVGQVQYQTPKGFQLLFKYRAKLKQKDYHNPANTKQVALGNYITQSARVQARYQWGECQLGTQVDYSQYNVVNNPADRGWAVSQFITHQLAKSKLQFTLQGIYFHTDSYQSRVYSYERSVLYNFSFPAYYGQGYRLSALVRYDVNPKLMFILKYGSTHYLQQNKQAQRMLQLQFRWKFEGIKK